MKPGFDLLYGSTFKFLNFGMPENFAEYNIKSNAWPNHWYIVQKYKKVTVSQDPGQTSKGAF